MILLVRVFKVLSVGFVTLAKSWWHFCFMMSMKKGKSRNSSGSSFGNATVFFIKRKNGWWFKQPLAERR